MYLYNSPSTSYVDTWPMSLFPFVISHLFLPPDDVCVEMKRPQVSHECIEFVSLVIARDNDCTEEKVIEIFHVFPRKRFV